MQEIWKDIPNYNNLYQVSNFGNVKSMAKSWVVGLGRVVSKKETILKPAFNGVGYLYVHLHKDGSSSNKLVHRLVWETFNGITDLQVDHINSIKTDNSLNNLQELSNRDNSSKYQKTKSTSSIYTGVRWHKKNKKWEARILIDGIRKYLGSFKEEVDAHNAYKNELNKIVLK